MAIQKQPTTFRRKQKFVAPRMQLKIIAIFGALGGAALLFQALIMSRALTILGESSGGMSTAVMAEARSLVLESLLFGCAFSLPLYILVGVVVTFRVAGPLHGIRQYLKRLASEGYTGPCEVRKDDEFQDLCQDLNRAIDAVRSPAGEAAATQAPAEPASALPAADQPVVK